ncbi:MAG: carbohydrate porin [Methyloceanibacter sp.]|jgi:porin|nr:carbohydrate porin [Methyloceanibacter sp.]
MRKTQIAPSDLARSRSGHELNRGAYRASLSKAMGALAVAMALFALPAEARADCDVTDTGIPDDAAFKLDAGGVRQGLARAGIGIGGYYYGETFYNWGGFDQGGEYDGVLELYINADMKKLGFWRGLCFHANGYQIHGNSITAANIGSLMPVSNLEATDATRLFELWFQQTMFNEKLSVRIGQLAADEEFVTSDGGGYFLNGTWGWPSITAADLPSGGPAYPLATPGVRVAINPNERLGLMIGVYNGDPAPACANEDPQRCNDHGLDFELDDDPLLMVEGVYRYNQKGRLPGAVKIGGWDHFGTFQDQRFDSGGALIAVTANDGRPLDHNWGLYGIIDQLVWRVPGSEETKGVGIFARFVGAPQDRNLIDFYADGGVTFTGMIPGRPDDAFAVGFAYTNISDRVSAFDVDFGEPVPRNYEALIEICYTYQINPGWSLQPNFQYIFQPGGNVAGVEDATVVGARTTIGF